MATQAVYQTSDEALLRLSAQNPELRFERNADGSVITTPPTGGISGNRELKVGSRLNVWVEDNQEGLGVTSLGIVDAGELPGIMKDEFNLEAGAVGAIDVCRPKFKVGGEQEDVVLFARQTPARTR